MQEAATAHEPCPDDDSDDLPPLEDNDSDYALALSLEMPPQGSQGWSCPQCTFLNDAINPLCEACGAPAPKKDWYDRWKERLAKL